MAAAMIAFYILLAYGVDRQDEKTACRVTSAGCHYLALVAVFLTTVQVVHIYVRIRKIIGHPTKAFMVKSMLLAWGA